MGVAANLASRHVRSASRRRAALMRHAQVDASPHEHCDGTHAERARARELYRALDSLPLAMRSAFVLCELDERSAQEAAEILGVPEATVRTRCFHARKKLSQKLRAEAPGGSR
jgi:RNA polymerase sigma-70 factor (ECF subfamily)